jgi:hypothetical protein
VLGDSGLLVLGHSAALGEYQCHLGSWKERGVEIRTSAPRRDAMPCKVGGMMGTGGVAPAEEGTRLLPPGHGL